MAALTNDETRWSDTSTSGSKETAGAASTLRHVRETYQGTDEDAKNGIRSKWQWR